MRCIIAGSSSINQYGYVEAAMDACGFAHKIDTIISGHAPYGVDRLGERWGKERGLCVLTRPALWQNLEASGAFIKYNRRGEPYNAKAGFDRNQRMADMCTPGEDALVAVWNGKSPGTADMISRARKRGLIVFVSIPPECSVHGSH